MGAVYNCYDAAAVRPRNAAAPARRSAEVAGSHGIYVCVRLSRAENRGEEGAWVGIEIGRLTWRFVVDDFVVLDGGIGFGVLYG